MSQSLKNDVRQDSRNVDPLQKEKCSAKEFLPQNPSDASVGRKFLPFSHFCSHYHVIANRMSAKGVFCDHMIASWGPADHFYLQYKSVINTFDTNNATGKKQALNLTTVQVIKYSNKEKDFKWAPYSIVVWILFIVILLQHVICLC